MRFNFVKLPTVALLLSTLSFSAYSAELSRNEAKELGLKIASRLGIKDIKDTSKRLVFKGVNDENKECRIEVYMGGWSDFSYTVGKILMVDSYNENELETRGAFSNFSKQPMSAKLSAEVKEDSESSFNVIQDFNITPGNFSRLLGDDYHDLTKTELFVESNAQGSPQRISLKKSRQMFHETFGGPRGNFSHVFNCNELKKMN